MPLLIDAHLDLALNALNYDRDITKSLEAMNAAKAHMDDAPFRGRGTVTLPEMRKAGLRFASRHCWRPPARDTHGRHITLAATWTAQRGIPRIAAVMHNWHITACWSAQRDSLAQIARGFGGPLVAVAIDRRSIAPSDRRHSLDGRRRPDSPIGTVVVLAGPSALRAIGPAHYGHSHYSAGTNAEGGLTTAGRELLGEMQRLGFVLDVTHLSDQAMAEAIDCFNAERSLR